MSDLTFNRTSLELKLSSPLRGQPPLMETFNRTSLELKQGIAKDMYQKLRYLLIAPVWN